MSREQTADLSRRHFVTTAATAAAAVTILPRHVLGGPGFVAPSDKVNVAIIGVGGQGRTNLRNLFHEPDCQVIALADPCEEWDLSRFYYGGKAGRGPIRAEIEQTYRAKTPNYSCAVYEDFRVMLEKEKAIDAVLIATPDHLHAYVSILADEGRQARLLREAAHQGRLGSPRGGEGREGDGRRHADGQPGALDRGPPPDRGVDLGRRHRRRARGALLGRVEPLRVGTGAPRGHAGGAGRLQLGPVARAPRGPPVSPRLRAVRLARVLGLRGRGAARPRDPPPRPGVPRARPRHPADRRGHGRRRRRLGGRRVRDAGRPGGSASARPSTGRWLR